MQFCQVALYKIVLLSCHYINIIFVWNAKMPKWFCVSFCIFIISQFPGVICFSILILKVEVLVSPCKEVPSNIGYLMADGRGIVQELWWSVAPFLNNRLLNSAGVAFGVDTDLLGNFDTVGFSYKPEII